jgi:hypothetical protein
VIKETPLLPRKPLSAPERHLCPQAMQKKGYKAQSPTWPTGPLVSESLCIPHYAVFLFSSLQIKSFWPLLLQSACAFILRAGSRALSTWNSCMCHLSITIRVWFRHCSHASSFKVWGCSFKTPHSPHLFVSSLHPWQITMEFLLSLLCLTAFISSF